MNNPILEQKELPIFDKINYEHVFDAIKTIVSENLNELKSIESIDPSLVNFDFVDRLNKLDYRLSNAWSQIGHINAVKNNNDFREAYNKSKELLTDYYTNLSQNKKLYNLFNLLKHSPNFSTLNKSQQKVIDNELRDFKLGGVDLPEEKKHHYKEIQAKLSKLSSKFEENVLDETNNFILHIKDSKDVEGIPSDILKTAKRLAEEDGHQGFYFTLQFPCYIPVLQYAENRNLRKSLYEAYAKKASEFSVKKFDNSPIIDEILDLRHQLANILGFDNFASLSLDTKMADSPEEVCSFLRELSLKAKPFAEKDLIDLEGYAKKDGVSILEAWDIAYYSEKIKQEKYDINDNEIKSYFPEYKVLKGLFNLVNELYDLDIRNKEVPVWDKSVKYFEIFQENKIIGSFYIDLYARKNKRGGAWMDECISKNKFSDKVHYPVAYLTCNFSSPSQEIPALFTHDEVITLFHEFGHGLHHLLTRVEEFSISGIKGVEWDAVELPSQFMENFCWDWTVIKNMTEHYETKESMPLDIFNKLVESKNFQAGMQTVRQVEFALFDMLIHMEKPSKKTNIIDTLEKVRDEVAVVRPPKWNRFPHSFGHIFSGGYAAGYYSYKWAEVLSADVFEEFINNGVLNKNIGDKFRREILSVGGSRTAKESFISFKGREPSIDALLKHNGLAA